MRIVGLLFTASLAIRNTDDSECDVIESLFGAFPTLSLPLLLAILLAALVLSALCFLLAKRLFLIVSPDLVRVHGLGRGYDLALLLIFAMIVALGIRLVGTLLMGALRHHPRVHRQEPGAEHAALRNLIRGFGGAVTVAGVWLAESFRFLPGPAIVLLGVGLFVLSLPFARRGTA
jgi:ABC-type Mn2+/Zn2+ transport system permease subunit